MCPDKVVSKYLMALVFVFIRPQFVDYWFLISRSIGFSAIEFIIIIFINDVVMYWISVAMNVTLTCFSTAWHPKWPFCNGVWRALILLASYLLGSFMRNVCFLFTNYIMVIPLPVPHCVQVEAPDDKLQIQRIGALTV